MQFCKALPHYLRGTSYNVGEVFDNSAGACCVAKGSDRDAPVRHDRHVSAGHQSSARPGADGSDANADAAWRMNVARQVAGAYRPSAPLAALTVAGSVGAGVADRWSDLELDSYWISAPSDRDRRDPIDRVGGVLEAFWEFDPSDQEWSENYRVGALEVTVSNFTVGSVDYFLGAVTRDADTDLVKHMRLAAVQRCQPLLGGELIGAWRSRAVRYPDRLADAMVELSLAPGVLAGWPAREALAERGDDVAVHALLGGIERAVLTALLALNRIYQPHRLLEWQRSLIAEFRRSPRQLAERLDSMWRSSYLSAFDQAEALLAETVQLASEHTRADLGPFHEALAERRLPADRPPPGRNRS